MSEINIEGFNIERRKKGIENFKYLLIDKKNGEELIIQPYTRRPTKVFLSQTVLGPQQLLRRLLRLSSLGRALDTPYSSRSFEEYTHELGVTEHELGSFVLDLGSGLGESFALGAQKRGIDVVSVNPKLSEEELRRKTESAVSLDTSYRRKAIAALAQGLPFKDNCFDSVISLYAVPVYLLHDEYEGVFREIIRVLKPGGRAFLHPVASKDLKICKEVLAGLSCSYDFERAPGPEGIDFSKLTIRKQETPVPASLR